MMSILRFSAVLFLAATASADTWSIWKYFPVGSCTSTPLYVSIVRNTGSTDCVRQQCFSAGGASAEVCCSNSEPQLGDTHMAFATFEGSSTCSGTKIAEIWFELDRCTAYTGSNVKYVKTNSTHVIAYTGCTDSNCQTGCSVSTYELGCVGIDATTGSSFSYHYTVGEGSTSIVCDAVSTSTSGQNNLGPGANSASSFAPFLALIAAAFLSVWLL